jgi:hypothetical protein
MRILTVRHATTYRYARPVTFGQHRLMLRPRDSHDLRLVAAELTLSPPGNLRWMHDVFGNSVALVDFNASAAMLTIISTLKIERYGLDGLQFPIAPEAEFYPFIYSSSDRVDLGRLLEQHYPDPNGVLARWADSFVTSRPMRTLELLTNMNGALKPDIIKGSMLMNLNAICPRKRLRRRPALVATSRWCSSKLRAISDLARASSAAICTTRHSIAVTQRKPLRRPATG